jgi:hypothetical protein
VSSQGLLMALPIATWEFSVGVYMTVKGFRSPVATQPGTVQPAATESDATVVPAGLAHA